MKNFKTYYKRNLPHYQSVGYTYFVTYRLNDSLPLEVIKKLKAEREKQLKEIDGISNKSLQQDKYKKMQSVYFGKFDKLLDTSDFGPTWLKKKEIAEIVKDAIHFYDNKKYNLVCYTIMSNHVHQVFTPIVGRDLSRPQESEDLSDKSNIDMNVDLQFPIVTDILRLIKGSTARECNKVLNRTGTFWQHESYDHVVRDYDELLRIVKYVLNNPVKIGLCEKWEDWKWSYCNNSYL
jgi:REP element-mobilizing transposase RayT